MAPPKIPEEDLVRELRRVANDLGHNPGVQEIRDHSAYSYSVYRDRFGGIGEALQAAGLDPADEPGKRGHGNIPEETLLTELQELAESLGHSPGVDDIDEHSRFSPETYWYRFGGLNSALEAAGLETRRPTELSEAELLDALRALADDLGHPPSSVEMDEHGPYSSSTYQRRYETWDGALDAAGVE